MTKLNSHERPEVLSSLCFVLGGLKTSWELIKIISQLQRSDACTTGNLAPTVRVLTSTTSERKCEFGPPV